jgi:hypothetical protein
MANNTPHIAPAEDRVISFKRWSLDRRLTPRNISAALKRKVRRNPKEDPKVNYRWEFTVDGEECAIWDYRGTRWSAYGPREAFEKLGLDIFPV